jgi:uncharacterized protein (DUF433 family)
MEHSINSQNPVVHSDPEILGGTPVFVGTRVPLRNLIDYLEGGHCLDEFLDDFPSVSRDQAIAASRTESFCGVPQARVLKSS